MSKPSCEYLASTSCGSGIVSKVTTRRIGRGGIIDHDLKVSYASGLFKGGVYDGFVIYVTFHRNGVPAYSFNSLYQVRDLRSTAAHQRCGVTLC